MLAQFVAEMVDLLTRLYPKLLRNADIAELSRTIVLEELKNDVGVAHRRHHNASGSGNPANASTGSGSGGVSPCRPTRTESLRRCCSACHVVRSRGSGPVCCP